MRCSPWVITVVCVLLAPASAAAATPAKLSFKGPSRVAAGANATFAVTVKAGSKKLSKGTVALTLSTDKKADKRDRKLGSKTVKNVKAKKSSKQSIKVTIPARPLRRATASSPA